MKMGEKTLKIHEKLKSGNPKKVCENFSALIHPPPSLKPTYGNFFSFLFSFSAYIKNPAPASNFFFCLSFSE